jgi:spermidine/putrescine transport system substrate-binding protein
MKKVMLFLLCGLFAFAGDKVLYVYNWSEYMPQSVLESFEKETGIDVKYSTYDSNEAMYAKIKTDQTSSYDIIVPSTYFVNKMAREGLLAKIDKSKLSNFKNLDEKLLYKPFDPKNDYSIPYTWGSTGISYNAAILGKGAISKWDDLWSLKYKNSLLLTDDLREVFGMTLKTLGYSANDQNEAHIKQAYEKLKLLMPNVKVYNSESPKDVYLSEEVVAGMNFNGENYMANEENPDLTYVYPKEGILLWIDSLVIPKNAKNIENAHLFINYLLRPEVAKLVSEDVGYATPNLKAKELMDDVVKNNRIVYPNEQDLLNSEFQVDLGDALPIYEKYWEKLKAGE